MVLAGVEEADLEAPGSRSGKRISVPEIMRVPWFRKDLTRQISPPIEELEPEPKSPKSESKSPKFLNAFEFISSMSSEENSSSRSFSWSKRRRRRSGRSMSVNRSRLKFARCMILKLRFNLFFVWIELIWT